MTTSSHEEVSPKERIDCTKPEKLSVITLCGSTRFKDEFEEVNRKLTLEGNVILSVGCFGHSGDEITDEQKQMLDKIHKQKIDMSDAIYVINKDDYIGNSTKSEIIYAKTHGKSVIFMVDPDREKYKDIFRFFK